MKYSLPVLILGIVLLVITLRFSHFYLSDSIRIANEIGQAAGTLNPFKYIQQTVSTLSLQNAAQHALLETSVREIREAVLNGLVYQGAERIDNLHDKLTEYGVRIDADYYRGLILTLTEPEKEEMLEITGREHMTILGIVNSSVAELQYLKMDGPHQMLFVSCSDGTPDRDQKLLNTLNGLCSVIMEAINRQVHILGGRETSHLEHLPWSFKSARDRMLADGADALPVALCSYAEHSCLYSYTDKDSRMLQHLAATANEEGIFAALSNIQHRNESNALLGAFERQMLYSHMLSTLLKAGYAGPLGDELTEHLSEIPIERFFSLLSAFYAQLCADNVEQKKQQRLQISVNMMATIREHLQDYEYSITDLALEYGCSERQMQQQMQNACGMSFSVYLEQCRIQKACELLKDRTLKIDDIAAQVGYASDKSFRRAFKRVTGVLPSEYRE